MENGYAAGYTSVNFGTSVDGLTGYGGNASGNQFAGSGNFGSTGAGHSGGH
jgi:hypothetical protein